MHAKSMWNFAPSAVSIFFELHHLSQALEKWSVTLLDFYFYCLLTGLLGPYKEIPSLILLHGLSLRGLCTILSALYFQVGTEQYG